MDYFLTYAGSVSFRELKNAIKKYFFLNLGGVGAKTRFLSKKNWGRILGLAGKNIGSACLIYMGGLDHPPPTDNSEYFEFQKLLKNSAPPLGPNSEMF